MPFHRVPWSVQSFQLFLMIAMRVGPLLFMMPLLSSRNVPMLVKVGLTLLVSLILLPVVEIDSSRWPSDLYAVLFFLVSEMMIGFIAGLSVKLLFAALQLAGELAGFQMGFSMANVVDPQSGIDSPLMGQFQYLFGLLLFLAVNGHHWFFRALAQSIQELPPGSFHLRTELYHYFVSLSGKMFIVALKIAAPVMAVLLFSQIALGMIAKTVPQIHVLLVSFPLTIGLGLLFLGLSMDLFVPYVETLLSESGRGLLSPLLILMKK